MRTGKIADVVMMLMPRFGFGPVGDDETIVSDM